MFTTQAKQRDDNYYKSKSKNYLNNVIESVAWILKKANYGELTFRDVYNTNKTTR